MSIIYKEKCVKCGKDIVRHRKTVNPSCQQCKSKIKSPNVIKNVRKSKYADIVRESDKLYQQKIRKENPLIKKDYNTKWREENREKILAHTAIRDALKKGEITKDKCRDCERIDTHGHHADYNKPLEVIWLCPIHHKQEHVKNSLLVEKDLH